MIVSSITGDFTINATANILQYTISYNLTNCTSTNTATTITYTQTYTTTLIANDGYILPRSIQITNANYNYNNTTGNLTISNPTGHVTITATATINLPQREQLFTLSLTSNYTSRLISLGITNNNKNLIIQANAANGTDFNGSTYSDNYNMPLQPINNTELNFNLRLDWETTQQLSELNYKVTLAYWDIETNSYKTKVYYTEASEVFNINYQYYITIYDFNLLNDWDYKYIANVTIQQMNYNPIAENLGISLLQLFTPFLNINIASITISSLFIIILALWLWRWLKHL